MAESDKIKSSEIIQPDLFQNTTKSAKELSDMLAVLEIGFEDIIKVQAKVLKSSKLETAKDIKVVTKAIEDEAAAEAGLYEVRKKSKQLTDAQAAAIQLENKARRDRINDIKQTAAANELEEGSIAKLRIQLSQTVKLYDNLSAAKRNAAKGKELEKSIADQTAALNKLEQATGRFQRNVGNYASGFNGLSNSINQIGRELPNFAIRFETGIQALSNNIPILAEEIQRLKKTNIELQSQGKPTVSLFKQISSAIFSWQTAITLGVTALVAFAPKIKEFFTGVKEGADDTEKLRIEQELLNDELAEYLELIDDSKINTLPQVIADLKKGNQEFLSLRDLKNALSEIDTRLDFIRVKRENIEGIGMVTSDEARIEAKIQMDALLVDRLLIENEIKKRDRKVKKERKDSQKENIQSEQDYLSLLQKLVEDWINTGIEMETDKYEKELRLENEGHRKLIDELTSYLGKSEDITRQANKNIEQEQERHFKEIIRIALDAANEQNIINNKIPNEEAERKRKADELLAKKSTEYKATQSKIRQKIETDELQNILINLENITEAYIVELDKRNSIQQEAFNKEINQKQSAIDRQSELAAQGLSNQLAFEKMTLAKKELEQKQALERAQKQKESAQLVEAYFSAFNAELQKQGADPTTAAGRALADVFLAKGISKGLVQYASEGNDMIDGQGTTTSDSIPFMLSKKEAVIKASENIKHNDAVKALNAGVFAEMYVPKHQYNEVLSKNSIESVANEYLLREYSKQTKLLEDIKNKPVQQVNYDSYGNLIETIYQSGVKTVIKHKTTRKRL